VFWKRQASSLMDPPNYHCKFTGPTLITEQERTVAKNEVDNGRFTGLQSIMDLNHADFMNKL